MRLLPWLLKIEVLLLAIRLKESKCDRVAVPGCDVFSNRFPSDFQALISGQTCEL